MFTWIRRLEEFPILDLNASSAKVRRDATPSETKVSSMDTIKLWNPSNKSII